MAPVVVDPSRVRTFDSAEAFETWLSDHHDREPEVWVRMFKKASGHASVDWAQAVPVALCWGWIDGQRKGLDAVSFLQRFTPRGAKSSWSEINVAHAERLIAEGRMQEPGRVQIEAAKADGRWAKTYRVKGAEVPDDLMAAIRAEPAALAVFETLTSQNRFALIFRTQQMRTAAGRAKKIASLVEMLARGETPHPQKATP